jgi:deoxyxylulose-5-phosphate synthase
LPDQFLDHGKAESLLADCGLDENGITASIIKKLESVA